MSRSAAKYPGHPGILTKNQIKMKIIKIKERVSGEIKFAQYAANRLGNLRMWVDGKFYCDKQFDKKFIILEITKN